MPKEQDAAIAVFSALRTFDAAALGMHHKRKGAPGEGGGNERDRMYGSVYYLNLARVVWEVTGKEDQDNTGVLRIAMVNRKHSNTASLRSIGYEIAYTMDSDDRLARLLFRRQDLRDMPDFRDKLSVAQRCLAELRDGAKSTTELAEALGLPDGQQIRTRLREQMAKGKVIQLPGSRKWALPA